MKRDTVVILSRSLPHHGLGGMEVVAWDLAKEFVRQNLKVSIITTPIPGQSGEFIEDGVQIIPLENIPSGRYSRLWWKKSKQYFEEHYMCTAQIVLSVSAAGFGLLPLKRKLKDVPFIMQAHGTSWGEFVSKWRSGRCKSILSSIRNIIWMPKDLWAYKQFDLIVTVGEQVSLDLIKPPSNWVLAKDKIKQIPNGIDTRLFKSSIESRSKIRRELKISEKTTIIISASRLHPQKGVGHGLMAFSRYLKINPDAIYFIAGDGPERRNLETLADSLNIKEQVRFLGAKTRDDLVNYLQIGDVFLFLSDRIEGLPLNVLEALAVGLPVVLSKHINVINSSDIHRVQQDDASLVAETINIISQQQKLGERCCLPIENSLEYVAKRYMDLFVG